MPKDKRSFFERLTGAVKIEHSEDDLDLEESTPARRITPSASSRRTPTNESEWIEETVEEGQLTVDVYQTANDIIIKTIVAGVKPEDLDISITRDIVTVRGKREEVREVSDDDFFHRELYWGSFARTVSLPEEIDVDGAEAIERHGLLTLKLPKLDKRRQTKLKVKTA